MIISSLTAISCQRAILGENSLVSSKKLSFRCAMKSHQWPATCGGGIVMETPKDWDWDSIAATLALGLGPRDGAWLPLVCMIQMVHLPSSRRYLYMWCTPSGFKMWEAALISWCLNAHFSPIHGSMKKLAWAIGVHAPLSFRFLFKTGHIHSLPQQFNLVTGHIVIVSLTMDLCGLTLLTLIPFTAASISSTVSFPHISPSDIGPM